jgi:hypothetical protein
MSTVYRHIDSAAAYSNEREVGEGIRRAGLKRSEVFIETKVWTLSTRLAAIFSRGWSILGQARSSSAPVGTVAGPATTRSPRDWSGRAPAQYRKHSSTSTARLRRSGHRTRSCTPGLAAAPVRGFACHADWWPAFEGLLIDDHSRLAYSEILPDEKGATCAAFLERAFAYFAAHGITGIERLMTDNARGHRYSPRGVCRAQHRAEVHPAPLPMQNGKIRRLKRTLATEWAYQVFTSNDQRTAVLAPWLEHYNTQRHYSALGGKPPISQLRT